MQVWLGHAVHLLMLLRPGLSLLWKVYQFAREHEDRRGRLWASVKKEIRAVAYIVFLTEADLALPLHPNVYCGDASKLGYDMMPRRHEKRYSRRSSSGNGGASSRRRSSPSCARAVRAGLRCEGRRRGRVLRPDWRKTCASA